VGVCIGLLVDRSVRSLRKVVLNLLAYAGVVRSLVVAELEHGLMLRRGVGVGVDEEGLDAQEDVFEGDTGLPFLLGVEDAQAHGAAGVDVGVEQHAP
jgi:hypothetical protein